MIPEKWATIVMIAIIAGLILFTWAAIVQISVAISNYRARRDVDLLMDGGVPINYKAAVVTAQTRLNDDISGSGSLYGVRSKVSRIRGNGYDVGVNDRSDYMAGLSENPHPQGSGEARQWVLGYCIGANILDAKKYMDES